MCNIPQLWQYYKKGKVCGKLYLLRDRPVNVFDVDTRVGADLPLASVRWVCGGDNYRWVCDGGYGPIAGLEVTEKEGIEGFPSSSGLDIIMCELQLRETELGTFVRHEPQYILAYWNVGNRNKSWETLQSRTLVCRGILLEIWHIGLACNRDLDVSKAA